MHNTYMYVKVLMHINAFPKFHHLRHIKKEESQCENMDIKFTSENFTVICETRIVKVIGKTSTENIFEATGKTLIHAFTEWFW